jgi:hypothetical protein
MAPNCFGCSVSPVREEVAEVENITSSSCRWNSAPALETFITFDAVPYKWQGWNLQSFILHLGHTYTIFSGESLLHF